MNIATPARIERERKCNAQLPRLKMVTGGYNVLGVKHLRVRVWRQLDCWWRLTENTTVEENKENYKVRKPAFPYGHFRPQHLR